MDKGFFGLRGYGGQEGGFFGEEFLLVYEGFVVGWDGVDWEGVVGVFAVEGLFLGGERFKGGGVGRD